MYLDDVINFRRNYNEHLKRLKLFFQRLVENEIKIKRSKFDFFQKRVSFVGHIISKSGVEINSEKNRAIERMKVPSSLNDVIAFLGRVGYYRKFCSGFRKNS